MPINRTPPTQQELDEWFGKTPPVPDGTFEFALVLGGTVSAGAYTAGAVDFLIQALDCFYRARGNGTPRHDVVLKLIAGTSGGGVNAAIACRALAYNYPHVTKGTPPEIAAGNPFYATWVNGLRLQGFLDTSDLDKSVEALLNGKPIDDVAAAIISFANGEPRRRAWIGDPLRAILTLTSVRGVPYRINFGDKLAQRYVDHADHIRYALVYPGQAIARPRPDELVLGFGPNDDLRGEKWQQFAEFAKATAAFPLGFPPRELVRPTEHYRWRPVPYPPFPGVPDHYLVPWPDWEKMEEGGEVPEQWRLLAVDGGATDNEPIQLARTALAGLLEQNPRPGDKAKRAVWLIDPFAGEAPVGTATKLPFPEMVATIATTLTQQTRYDTADLILAGDIDVYSRFMLTPTNDDETRIGADTIASSGFGAFIGFACQDFMRHDYLLGRKNCRKFLRDTFVLDDNNPLFANWTSPEKTQFAVPDKPGKLPIIPLIGEAYSEVETDPWPKDKLDPEVYRSAIEARFSALLKKEVSGSLVRSVLSWIGAQATQQHVADYVITAARQSLKDAGLLTSE